MPRRLTSRPHLVATAVACLLLIGFPIGKAFSQDSTVDRGIKLRCSLTKAIGTSADAKVKIVITNNTDSAKARLQIGNSDGMARIFDLIIKEGKLIPNCQIN